MAKQEALTAEQLREILDYDPLTGEFRWRIKRCAQRPVGAIAGSRRRGNRLTISIDGFGYIGARLAWLHYYGEWPKGEIDHRDLDPSNDRIVNLRDATRPQNVCNTKARSKHGFKGISPHGRKWAGHVRANGKLYFLGQFHTKEEAARAYDAAARKFFGEFAKLNYPVEQNG